MLNTINNSVASQGPKGTAEDQIVVAYDIRGWRCACERPSPTMSKVRSRLTVSEAGVPSVVDPARAVPGRDGQPGPKVGPCPAPTGKGCWARRSALDSSLHTAGRVLLVSRCVALAVCVCVWRHHRLTLPLLVCEGC